MDKSKEFTDRIDELNKLARAHGCSCARAWACRAEKKGLISRSLRIRIENLIDLRNTVGHGNARYVAISSRAVDDLKGVIRMMNSMDMNASRKPAARMPKGIFRRN